MTRYCLKKTTTVKADGTRVVKQNLVAAPELEWRIQAESVRQVKALPEFDTLFTLAGDMNAARRSPAEATKAKATGIAAGDPDCRFYFAGGKLGMIEYKGKNGRLSPEQIKRHALLLGLGFDVRVVKAATAEEGAAATVKQVREWLNLWVAPRAANDNGKVKSRAA